jgi:DMSO/TMAO reductase YedYZ molybdopterin-dependent catalytic subunit
MRALKGSVLFLAAALGLAACATSEERHLASSPVVPAAQGTARFDKTKNDNVSIDLTVKHLADPQKLTPPSAVYVVWLQANKSSPPQNIGLLKVDEDLNGSLSTQTAARSFDLFITAEGSGQVLAPAGKPLLWTSYSP